ncbi:MAG: MFS transporter [Promethearchaeota archaeon]
MEEEEKVAMELTSNQQTFQHYIIFWIGQLFSVLGSSVVFFALIWWITIESQSATILSLAFFFSMIPQIFVTLFAGVFIDRLDRKKIIIFADFGQALITLIIILMFVFNIASIWGVISLMIIRNLFQAIHQPAVAAIIPVMIPKEKLSRMNVINMLITSAIYVVGPVISGILIGFLDIENIEIILWIDVGTFLLAIIPTLLITIPSVKKEPKTKTDVKISFKKEFKEGGYRAIMQIKGMFAFFISCIILNSLISPSAVLRPYFISIYHEGDAIMLSYISASIQIGMICGGLFILLRKQWKRKSMMIIVAFFIQGISYLVTSLAPKGDFLTLIIALFFFGIGFPIINSLYLTILQEVVPLDMQGRVNSIDIALSISIMPIAVLISGPIAEAIGVNYLFMILAALSLIILTIAVLFTDIRYMDKGIMKEEFVNSSLEEE